MTLSPDLQQRLQTLLEREFADIWESHHLLAGRVIDELSEDTPLTPEEKGLVEVIVQQWFDKHYE